MSDRRSAAVDALELMLLADLQDLADQLADRVEDAAIKARREAEDLNDALPFNMDHPDFLPTARQDALRDDWEAAEWREARLWRWYGALIAVTAACDERSAA